MLRQDAEKYLNAAMAVGEATLRYGGEVSRVEDSIRSLPVGQRFKVEKGSIEKENG